MSYLDTIEQTGFTEVTVSELETLISTSGLTPQAWYLITDYQTVDYIRQASESQTVTIPIYYTAPVEQICVQASSANTLYYKGFSKTYVGEEIGYLQSRSDVYLTPTFYYYGSSNTEPVEIEPLTSDVFTFSSNPYPNQAYTSTDFYCYVSDEDSGIQFEFTSTNKGTKWDFNEDHDFEIIDNNFDYPIWTYTWWSTSDGNGDTQEIDVLSDTRFELTTPETDANNYIYEQDANFSIYDDDAGAYAYFDTLNKDVSWEINSTNPAYIDILDNRTNKSCYVFYTPENGNEGSYEVVIESANQFSVVYDFDINVGTYASGTTGFYVYFASDDVEISCDYTNYGTVWSASGNIITLIGDTHDLETDLGYIDGTIWGNDNNSFVYPYTSSYSEITASWLKYEQRSIDLTSSGTEISGQWSYLHQELGGLVVNRTNGNKITDIDVDYRGTKFRRYNLITYPEYSSGTVYVQYDVVRYNNQLYVKLYSDGLSGYSPTSTSPTIWGLLDINSSYSYGKDGFYINFSSTGGVTLQANFSDYRDTDWLGGTSYTLTNTVNNTTIRNARREYSLNLGVDIVLTYGYSNNIVKNNIEWYVFTNGIYVTVYSLSNSTILIGGNFVVQGQVYNCKIDYLSNVLGTGNLSYTNCKSMNTFCFRNMSYFDITGYISNSIMAYVNASNINTSLGAVQYCIFGQSVFDNPLLKTLYKVEFKGIVQGNTVNQIKESSFGWTFRGNDVSGEIYGYDSTRGSQFTFNTVTYWMGIALSGVNYKAGTFTSSVNYSKFYGLVQINTNSNIGSSRYNTFYSINSCTFNGYVTGNYLPNMTLADTTFNKGFTQNDEVNTSSSYADRISQSYFFGDMYNNRFTGRMSIQNCRLMHTFNNNFFGDGTFASPTQNNAYKQFHYNVILGTCDYINIKTGYVNNNTWLGSVGPFSTTYVVFNQGDGVSVDNNVFGPNFKGNTFNARVSGCTVGSEFGNNTINHQLIDCEIGNYVRGNTTSGNLQSIKINSGINGYTLPSSIPQGYAFNSLGIKSSSSTVGLIMELQNSSGTQLYVFQNNGLTGIGSSSPDSRLSVYRPSTCVGTVSNTAGSSNISGSGTIFLDTFKVGDTITFSGNTYTIATIVSNISLTLTTTVTNANSGVSYTTTGRPALFVKSHGYVGIQTSKPDKALEINDNEGKCLRLTYDDENGSATNYTDLEISSSGDLTITPSGGDITTTATLKTGGYTSSLNNAGITQDVAFRDYNNELHTLHFENGILVQYDEP